MKIVHSDIQQEKSTKDSMEENTEEKFLKNLYIFMKKRDTPIERIPNLGFKQSNYERFIVSALDLSLFIILAQMIWVKLMF